MEVEVLQEALIEKASEGSTEEAIMEEEDEEEEEEKEEEEVAVTMIREEIKEIKYNQDG